MHPYPDGLGHEVNDSPRQPPRNGGNRPETSTLSGSKRLCLISGLQINSPIGERYEVQNGSTEKDGSDCRGFGGLFDDGRMRGKGSDRLK